MLLILIQLLMQDLIFYDSLNNLLTIYLTLRLDLNYLLDNLASCSQISKKKLEINYKLLSLYKLII